MILPGCIWGHTSCCTEEKYFLPCTAGTKDVLLGVDFGCLTWQMPMTYPPQKLPDALNVLNLQHQLHLHGYPWSNSYPHPPPLAALSCLGPRKWMEFRSQVGSSSRLFCSFEFVVRQWLSLPSGEYPLSIRHAMCNTSDGYASAEAACNYSVILVMHIATSLCIQAATWHSKWGWHPFSPLKGNI